MQTFTENENIDTFRVVYKNILMHQKFPIDVQIKISAIHGRRFISNWRYKISWTQLAEARWKTEFEKKT